jgi:hypothetical protein
MTVADYYNVLGISSDSSLDDIKRAYRKKARQYHPDLNHSPEAKELFIKATEAYEFLLSNFNRVRDDEAAYRQAMEDWRKYRQDRSNRRANAYARASYIKFKSTKIYRTTRIFDATRIIYSLVISVIILVYTIAGYIYRLHHPLPPQIEGPSISGFILLLLTGLSFLIVSLIYLKAFYDTRKKSKK